MAGLYIHIPFCRSKCAYCDFYSVPSAGGLEGYVETVLKEFDMRREEVQEPFTTLYLGGGTPSLLPDKALSSLMEGLDIRIGLGNLTETTIEANPEDISDDKLKFYLSIGINRVSIGVQSFDNSELMAVSRHHAAVASVAALESLAKSGMNYNADLIYGLPGQNLEAWKRNLERMMSYRPPHMSAYLLSYEQGTRLYAKLMKGEVSEAADSEVVEMYQLLCEMAAKGGYGHYEVSNFALPGCRARHNSAYWTYTPYLGLGPSAHSFDGCIRRFNPAGVKQYVAAISSGEPFFAVDDEDDSNRFNDYIITSLRTSEGFDSDFAKRMFGGGMLERFMDNAGKLPESSLEFCGDFIRIPESEWLRSDAIFRELLIV